MSLPKGKILLGFCLFLLHGLLRAATICFFQCHQHLVNILVSYQAKSSLFPVRVEVVNQV